MKKIKFVDIDKLNHESIIGVKSPSGQKGFIVNNINEYMFVGYNDLCYSGNIKRSNIKDLMYEFNASCYEIYKFGSITELGDWLSDKNIYVSRLQIIFFIVLLFILIFNSCI